MSLRRFKLAAVARAQASWKAGIFRLALVACPPTIYVMWEPYPTVATIAALLFVGGAGWYIGRQTGFWEGFELGNRLQK